MDKINIALNTDLLIEWIKQYFNAEGPNAKAVIGISGGKDSTVAAALCVAALGRDRVLGVKMPCNGQKDINDSNRIIEYLDIESYELDIGKCYNELVLMFVNNNLYPNQVVATNMPARLRMTTLYAVAAMVGGRVVNTSNASEIYVGYSTKWGDNVGDLALFKNLTSEEVVAIGLELGLPEDLVIKAPSDGMSGKTDEDNLGFKYREVNAIIRHSDNDICNYIEIQRKHRYSEHKRLPIPAFEPRLEREIDLNDYENEEKSLIK